MTDETKTDETENQQPAAANDEPQPVSVEEASAIFAERPDVAAVLTVNGTMHRDGSFS